jgi:uncharacterized protein YbaR (Trm112 family)
MALGLIVPRNLARALGSALDFTLLTTTRITAFRRRLFLGIGPRDLVLDVGSGHRPHPRADVLCDRYLTDNAQRADGMVRDRPVVVADVTALPFATKSFDFVICQHVLEHVPEVERALVELSRIGKRGYIETPSRLWETLMGREYHLWLVERVADRLIFSRKVAALDKELVGSFVRLSTKSRAWNRTILENFDTFYSTMKWNDRIPYEIHSGNAPALPAIFHGDTDWPQRGGRYSAVEGRLRRGVYSALTRVMRSGRRVDVWDLLVCPKCKQRVSINGARTQITCHTCAVSYPVQDGIPIMLIEEARPLT